MKSLTLLRHAKSGWDDLVSRDFDRPLNPRGRRAARTVALAMKAEGLEFHLVLASPARRVIETLEEVEAAFGPVRPDYDKRLYLASTSTLLWPPASWWAFPPKRCTDWVRAPTTMPPSPRSSRPRAGRPTTH